MSIEPELILFISVDLTGSTAFKNVKNATADKSKDPLPWLDAFLRFYESFPQRFFNKFDSQDDRPKFWKHIGDELLLYVPLKSSDHCVRVMTSLIETVREYIDEGQLRENNLGVKCTAWTAGFPVNNFKFTVPGSDGIPRLPTADQKYPIDFIGPDIDLGFRLSKYASPQKCVISVDLAYLLINTNTPESFHWHYAGRQELKGFHKKGGYPVVWIEADLDEMDKVEVELGHMPEITIHAKLKQLFLTFLSDRPFMPFIPASGSYPLIYGEYLAIALGYLERYFDAELTDKSEQDEFSDNMST